MDRKPTSVAIIFLLAILFFSRMTSLAFAALGDVASVTEIAVQTEEKEAKTEEEEAILQEKKEA